jgi:hypothetical protein
MFFLNAILAFSVMSHSEPSFEDPKSQLATQSQFHEPAFKYWSDELKQHYRYHRKLWEFCYVAQVLNSYGYLKQGNSGLGFAVGTEPLPALFAKYGCKVLATDQDFENALEQGWVHTNQHLFYKDRLNELNICPENLFNENVNIGVLDMNNLANAQPQYDFVWSCCSFEHLGSIEKGLDFFVNSMNYLKPGGIAVHTTEYNLSSNLDTIESGSTVLFRLQDIKKLATRLENLGYKVLDLNVNPGKQPLDIFIDLPPYSCDKHLKLQLFNKYACTSIGIVAFKPL